MRKGPTNYSKACVYQICCKDVEIKDVYVGSTTNLIERRRGHKVACTKESNKGHNLPVYQIIRDHGGWDNWEVIKVEDAHVNCREDLLKIERACMERLGATLNKCVPGRSKKEYQEVNKEKIVEYQKEYYEATKEQKKEYQKDYYEANKEHIKEYYEATKEQRKEKVTCQCGSVVRKDTMTRHCKTAKHQKYLESLSSSNST